MAKSNTDSGKEGELAAAEYLKNLGYEIVTMNYRYSRNEIDIIAKKADLLIFVEVKTKSYVTFGFPEESVNERKAARVIEAAENYVFETDWQGDIRFDIISVEVNKGRPTIIHFEDAFY